MKTKKIVKSIVGLFAIAVLCCGCAGGYTSDEPCVWCNHTPTKKFKTTNGTTCFVCEDHAKTCAICNKSFDMETNMLDVEVFTCDDCYEEYYKS